MSDSSAPRQWANILVLTAILLSLVVLAQILSRYGAAYAAAPREITAFLDSVDSSVHENEGYDRDVSRVRRLEDKIRLSRLLGEIQKGGDDLREELNGLLVAPTGSASALRLPKDNDAEGQTEKENPLIEDAPPRLRTTSRLLWASRRARLEERLRRLDLLRMRFLVVYMSIVAANTTAAAEKVEKTAVATSPRDPEKSGHPVSPGLPPALAEGIKRKPPMRRLTTQAIGHIDTSGGGHRMGWAGVVRELQMSPLLHKRHASIEKAMAATP